MLTNRLTGTTEATATTATNTEILRPPTPAGQPPSRAHPKAHLLAIPIRPRSGDPLLTRGNTSLARPTIASVVRIASVVGVGGHVSGRSWIRGGVERLPSGSFR